MAETHTGTEIPPNVTIYINNLNEKIKLDGTPTFLTNPHFLISLNLVFWGLKMDFIFWG